jgi:hypothetical protein
MFISGRLTLVAPDVATPLITGDHPARRITNITLQAADANVGPVYVGGSDVVSTPIGSTTGIALQPGAAESFSATDAADVFVAGPAGNAVRFRAKAL